MTLSYTVRPISDRTWFRPASQRERSRFTASWTDTLALLERELDHLAAQRMVFELDVREQDIRLDGMVRANARPAASDAVVIAFDSKHGPLQYRSDIYDAVAWGARGSAPWQANVRAVALTLEALRAVDRYGASSRGEQYRGYKALPSAATTLDEAAAVAVLQRWAPESKRDAPLTRLARWARVGAHPDRHNGDHAASNEVLAAIQALGLDN